ncbi:MAG: hypothetical protein ACYS1A_20350 [Planctomycetota bacterium]|jgi:hypothetical protein
MRYNTSGEVTDYVGDKMSWEQVARALWELLDSIDTLPDMLKPGTEVAHDKCWRMMVGRAEKRHKYLVSDGYTLVKELK